jgi:NAD/NADP transhydrogenase alpha subunit
MNVVQARLRVGVVRESTQGETGGAPVPNALPGLIAKGLDTVAESGTGRSLADLRNFQVLSDEVFETIDYAMFKTKLMKPPIVEQAALAHSSEYRLKARLP